MTKVVSKLLPTNSPKRLGVINPEFITIHETSLGTELRPKERDFHYYYDILLHSENQIGYHFLVEANYDNDGVIYQFLETSVMTRHSGTLEGNSRSIGIERLVNVETDMDRAIDLQAQLAATLMNMYNIPIENVVPHKYWSGKECPARLLAGMYGWNWEKFIKRVKYHFENHNWIKGIV